MRWMTDDTLSLSHRFIIFCHYFLSHFYSTHRHRRLEKIMVVFVALRAARKKKKTKTTKEEEEEDER